MQFIVSKYNVPRLSGRQKHLFQENALSHLELQNHSDKLNREVFCHWKIAEIRTNSRRLKQKVIVCFSLGSTTL